ncbi:hypothetical protein TNCV_119031 [Trichonephila clavipes]|nr:hypothetical protein TNCV_119031 [Trichonephila clavipes]
MKKSAAEAHEMLSNTYGETAIIKERAESGFNASRTVILTSKTSMAFGGTSSAPVWSPLSSTVSSARSCPGLPGPVILDTRSLPALFCRWLDLPDVYLM